MSEVSATEAQEIVKALRVGAVPNVGLHHFATGLDPLMQVVEQELAHVGGGAGSSKWIRGAYGSGKTFCTRLLCDRARALGFATSEIQISSTWIAPSMALAPCLKMPGWRWASRRRRA